MRQRVKDKTIAKKASRSEFYLGRCQTRSLCAKQARLLTFSPVQTRIAGPFNKRVRRRSCSHFMPPLHTSVPHWCHPYKKCLDTPLRGGCPNQKGMRCMQLQGQATVLAQVPEPLRDPQSGHGLANCVAGEQGLIECRPGAAWQVPAHGWEWTEGTVSLTNHNRSAFTCCIRFAVQN